MAVDLCASSLSSSAAGALKLSWRLHGSYHQTRAYVQNEEYINTDLPKARGKKLVITNHNFSSSIQSLLRFTRLTENTSLSYCFSSCRHEIVFTIRNKKNCCACGRSLFWQKPLLMEGDVLLIISSLWNSQHHFPHCSNQIYKDYKENGHYSKFTTPFIRTCLTTNSFQWTGRYQMSHETHTHTKQPLFKKWTVEGDYFGSRKIKEGCFAYSFLFTVCLKRTMFFLKLHLKWIQMLYCH